MQQQVLAEVFNSSSGSPHCSLAGSPGCVCVFGWERLQVFLQGSEPST